jgi:hypothetical protein
MLRGCAERRRKRRPEMQTLPGVPPMVTLKRDMERVGQGATDTD